MRFLHVGDNICGIPSALARAQRENGQRADVMSFTIDSQGHLADKQYNTRSLSMKVLHLLQVIRNYDVIMFVGNSLLPRGLDIPFWRLLGKKVTVEYHGTEIRGRKQYFFHRFASRVFVSTPDLLDDVPTAIWLPNPIFANEYPTWNPKNQNIVHATTDSELSGTNYLLEAMGNVHRLHPKAKLDVVSGIAYKDALKRYSEALIAIDKLSTVGYVGMFGLECMAIGVPVMVYVSPAVLQRIQRPYPFYVLSHRTVVGALEQEIVDLMYDDDYRRFLTVEGRKYVASVHNPSIIAYTISESLKDE